MDNPVVFTGAFVGAVVTGGLGLSLLRRTRTTGVLVVLVGLAFGIAYAAIVMAILIFGGVS